MNGCACSRRCRGGEIRGHGGEGKRGLRLVRGQGSGGEAALEKGDWSDMTVPSTGRLAQFYYPEEETIWGVDLGDIGRGAGPDGDCFGIRSVTG